MKAEEMPIGAITVRFQVSYKLENLAKQLIVESLLSIQELIDHAESFTEKRNGETITLEDVTKAMGTYDDDTIIAIERTLADAKAHKKRYEQVD